MATEFKLPDLGEGIDSAEVVRVLVSDGDTVEEDQPVLEVEAEKASLEVPSDVAGKVSQVHVKEGDTVKIGQAILSMEAGKETGDGRKAGRPTEAERERPAAEEAPEEEATRADAKEAAVEAETEEEVRGAERKPEKGKVEAKEVAAEEEAGERERPAEEEPEREKVRAKTRGATEEEEAKEEEPERKAAEPTPATGAAEARKASGVPPAEEREPVAAAPSVRQFAREIGVDIAEVTGSGPGGRISIDDVKEHARRGEGARGRGGDGARGRRGDKTSELAPSPARPLAPSPERPVAERPPLPDFEKFGRISREPISSVRRAVARQMSLSWTTIPHVTLFDEADVTALEAVRERYKGRAEEADAKLTITVIMLKIAAVALKVFPRLNASVDMDGGEIIFKQYYHLGVATDTERGLLVPVIRDVDKKSMIQLSVELAQIAERARHGMLSREEMQGGSFTVTSLGGIGTAFFTPIINPPEVAILGLGRIRPQPGPDSQAPPRLMLPLSLSIDHRAVDGAEGARFLQWIIEAVNQPLMLAMEG